MAAKKTEKQETAKTKIARLVPGDRVGYAALLSPRLKKPMVRVTPYQEVKTPQAPKKRKRVGRGRSAGQGKTCGRGQKGQKSRTGYSRKFGFEGGQMPLHRRLPKRGFTSIFKEEYQLVNLVNLEKSGLSGAITPDTLVQGGLIGSPRKLVKILGNGEVTKSMQITADAFSGSARSKIESAGGTCTLRDRAELRRLQKRTGSESGKAAAGKKA